MAHMFAVGCVLYEHEHYGKTCFWSVMVHMLFDCDADLSAICFKCCLDGWHDECNAIRCYMCVHNKLCSMLSHDRAGFWMLDVMCNHLMSTHVNQVYVMLARYV